MFPSPKRNWTDEDMDKLIRRTISLIKSTMTVTIANVTEQAKFRSVTVPKNAIGPYLNRISVKKRIELGFPDPSAKKKADSTPSKMPSSESSTEKAG